MSDNATSTEIVEDTEKGARYKVDMEKYADKVVYEDGLDADAVKEWNDSLKSGGSSTTKTKGSAKAAGFGAKRGFGAPSKEQ